MSPKLSQQIGKISIKQTTEPAKKTTTDVKNQGESSIAKSSDSRDPRIRNKIKSMQLSNNGNNDNNKVTVIETNIFEPKASNNKLSNTSLSPPKNKSKSISINSSSANSSNGIKRSSPNSLSQGDVKKPKLTVNQTSPVGSDKVPKVIKAPKSASVSQQKTESSQEQSSSGKINPKSPSLKTHKAVSSKGGLYRIF